MHITAFPKIAALGTRHVANIFEDEVEVTEKIDGSQFCFGWTQEGEFQCRSKGKQQHEGAVDKMFALAVDYTSALSPIPGHSFYCEYLQRPKHNSLVYERVPLNNLILFGVADFAREYFISGHEHLMRWAERLDIEVIPLLFYGSTNAAEIVGMVHSEEGKQTDSILGGDFGIEGVVIKNYKREMDYGERVYPLMSAKFVTEAFKERHSKNKEYMPRTDKWMEYLNSLRTDARWLKAVQRLRDKGEATFTPKDIGPMIKDIQTDTVTEHKAEALDILWKLYGGELTRRCTAGFPEWYKEQLALGNFAHMMQHPDDSIDLLARNDYEAVVPMIRTGDPATVPDYNKSVEEKGSDWVDTDQASE